MPGAPPRQFSRIRYPYQRTPLTLTGEHSSSGSRHLLEAVIAVQRIYGAGLDGLDWRWTPRERSFHARSGSSPGLGKVGHDATQTTGSPRGQCGYDPFVQLLTRKAPLGEVVAQLSDGAFPVGIGDPDAVIYCRARSLVMRPAWRHPDSHAWPRRAGGPGGGSLAAHSIRRSAMPSHRTTESSRTSLA